MNTVILRAGMPGIQPDAGGRGAAVGTGLWLFIGVASMLFALFLLTFLMRMTANDWSVIAMPRQLWLSSALLLAGSVALQLARHADAPRARRLLLWGAAFAVLFVACQAWAWQSLLATRVTLNGNPAASFFYLLTALHALHVLGGLAACAVTLRRAWRNDQPDSVRWLIALCARYWHFLLALWLVLFAALGGMTPSLARAICGID